MSDTFPALWTYLHHDSYAPRSNSQHAVLLEVEKIAGLLFLPEEIDAITD